MLLLRSLIMDAGWIIVMEDQGKNHKDDDFYIATWNVFSLYGAGTLKQLKTELEKYRIDIAAVQEIRCKGS
jgi:hypothetical protein